MSTPSSPLTDPALERLARRRAGAKMGWFIHALVYVCVNLGLALLAWRSAHPWNLYPLAGWGAGLALHGAALWLAGGGTGLHERLLQSERERLGRRG